LLESIAREEDDEEEEEEAAKTWRLCFLRFLEDKRAELL
jgi:hypothetical protein